MPTYHVQVKSDDKKLIGALKKIVKQTNEKGMGQVTARYKEFDVDKHQMSFNYSTVMPRVIFKKVVFGEIEKGIGKKFPNAKVLLVGEKSTKDKVKQKLTGG